MYWSSSKLNKKFVSTFTISIFIDYFLKKVVWGEPQKVIEPICNSENCPDIIISFGEASKVFEIETVARKHRSAEATDEHFNTPTKIEIYDDGEDLYEACFDAHSVMSRILEKQKIKLPWVISKDAG